MIYLELRNISITKEVLIPYARKQNSKAQSDDYVVC